MTIGTVLYNQTYGRLVVTRKAYSPVKNAVVWYAMDSQGTERPLDGTETSKEPKEPVDVLSKVSMLKGDKGDKGDQGVMGPRGFKGDKGDRGEKGDKGDKGEKGEPGKDGKDGKDGKEGKRGLQGERGKEGKKGENGDPGKDGKDGRDGKDGLNGLNGGGGIHKIDDADDVRISNPTNGQALKYNSTTGKWENGTVSGGSGSLDSVVAGNNIDVDNTDPANPVISVETLTLADISDVTASVTEINYVDGVTSAIQTQLDTKAADADVVHDTGDETIAGIKTFSSSPIVPTPTTDFQAATKKYVDDNAGSGGINESLAIAYAVSL